MFFFFLRNLVFTIRKEQQKIPCCWQMGVKQLRLFLVTRYHSLAVKLACQTSTFIKPVVVLG